MKIVAKQIEVVCWMDTKGNINPVRLKITNDDESESVVKIGRVICIDKERVVCTQ